MFTDDEIRRLYDKYGNKTYPVDMCIGCQNCSTYSFPCLNCAAHVFDYKIGCGNPKEMVPDVETPLDMFRFLHYNEQEIKRMIPPVCPGAPRKRPKVDHNLNLEPRRLNFE
jgi:hypothetical protein